MVVEQIETIESEEHWNYQPSHSRNDQSIATTHSVDTARPGCPRLQVPRLQTKCMYSPRSPARKMQSWRASCTWPQKPVTTSGQKKIKMATSEFRWLIKLYNQVIIICSRYIRIATLWHSPILDTQFKFGYPFSRKKHKAPRISYKLQSSHWVRNRKSYSDHQQRLENILP